jgi:hypothetical protein
MTALIIVYVIGVFFVGTCLFWAMKDSGRDIYFSDLMNCCVLTLFSWLSILLSVVLYFICCISEYCDKVVIIKRKKEDEE